MKIRDCLWIVSVSSLLLFSGCGDSDDTTTQVTPEPMSQLGDREVQEDGTIRYVDYKGETRVAVAHAGLAEYHTGTGYGETLFDSADKKCQHCHNKLYDTWKSSMHSKSWSDPVFQAKYEEYLRVQLSNIGKSANGVTFTAGTLTGPTSDTTKGTSKTCLKCHAPGGFYAGDFNITVTNVADSSAYTSLDTDGLRSYLTALESGKGDVLTPTTVAAVGFDGNVYKVTYHVGHEANREGINCATCHSIETVRLMGLPNTGLDGVRDNGEYTLKSAIKYGPLGLTRYAAGETLQYDTNASDPQMNSFFFLVGPDVYADKSATPQTAAGLNNIAQKTSDGRFTFRSIDLNGTNAKVHYTGGPFYGPYGITGTNNSNADDESDRLSSSLGEDVYHAKDNHFSKNAKALCLSCHQRSAGAMDPASNIGAGHDATLENHMELCSTWSVTSDEVDNNWQDTASSPKCTKCHMPRVDADAVLHKWAEPDKLFSRDELLTGYFDPEDGDGYGATHNPTVGKWMNDHGFIGGNKLTGANYLAKIKSGFDATLDAQINGTELVVTTTLLNKTAHMFPGAHPMRRMLTRVVVTDSDGNNVAYDSTTGVSTFANIINTVVPSNASDTINTSGTGRGSVGVEYDANRKIQISGLQADLNGSAVSGQTFNPETVTIAASDVIAKIVAVEGNIAKSTISRNNIIDDANTSTFTRIYGHETGKVFDSKFTVRPGFDSNTVALDNRLTPNEQENYTIKYTVDPTKTYTITYKVYYMPKGANGQFPVGSDGFLKPTAEMTDTQKTFWIEEVYSQTLSK